MPCDIGPQQAGGTAVNHPSPHSFGIISPRSALGLRHSVDHAVAASHAENKGTCFPRMVIFTEREMVSACIGLDSLRLECFCAGWMRSFEVDVNRLAV